jgi:integron integrase
MLNIPPALLKQYEVFLRNKTIPISFQGTYKKWLRYYLDFCRKDHFHPSQNARLPPFIRKLQDKKQTNEQREQAAKAINLYYELCKAKDPDSIGTVLQMNDQGYATWNDSHQTKLHENTGLSIKAEEANLSLSGASWRAEYSRLEDEIRVRHYSAKTLKTYKGWVQKFQAFTSSKSPALLSPTDVKEFLSFLAVKRQVSATTQNQAFNALLFFYRHILHKEFGTIDGVVRAKRKPYIPVGLSRDEIESILQYLEYPCDLVVKLLYGCGLRLFECLGLRVHSINFDAGILTVHDGKGQKDRTVPLPETILPEMQKHLGFLKKLHQRDLDKKYAGVFLVNALEQKYKNASKEFIWQWFFPAKQLTYDKEAAEYRRYHLHETLGQKAIKDAVNKSRICKRASAHTFRHSFASHLLQANYDIRTIQELLGHSDVRTTMIYTHTVKSRTLKEAKSPLDF